MRPMQFLPRFAGVAVRRRSAGSKAWIAAIPWPKRPQIRDPQRANGASLQTGHLGCFPSPPHQSRPPVL